MISRGINFKVHLKFQDCNCSKDHRAHAPFCKNCCYTTAGFREFFEETFFIGKLFSRCHGQTWFYKHSKALKFPFNFFVKKICFKRKDIPLEFPLEKLASISKEGCKLMHFSSVPKIEIWLRQGYTLLIWVIFFRTGENINTLFIKKTVMENFDIKPSPAHVLLKQLKNLFCVTAKPK